MLLSVIGKYENRYQIGRVIFCAGLIFFGLWTMDKAVEPLREYPPFFEWMKKLESPIQGGLVTLII